MKIFKIFLATLLVSLFFTSKISAREKRLDFSLGYQGFKNIPAGFIWKSRFSYPLDKQTTIGIEGNLFRKTKKNSEIVSDSLYSNGTYESTAKTEKKCSQTVIPIFLSIDIDLHKFNHIPLRYKTGGGVGYQVLVSSTQNYQTGNLETRTYHGWAWFIKTGIEYNLSEKTDIIFNLVYRSSVVSKEAEIDIDVPTQDRVNLSGLGIELGLNINLSR